jgi:hypothetical protein
MVIFHSYVSLPECILLYSVFIRVLNQPMLFDLVIQMVNTVLIYRNEPDHRGFSTNPQLQQEFSIFVPEIRSLFSTTYPQKMTGFKAIWWQHISSGYCLLIPSGNLTGLLWQITILKGKLSINGGRSRATLPGQPVTLMSIKNAWMKIQGEIRFFQICL